MELFGQPQQAEHLIIHNCSLKRLQADDAISAYSQLRMQLVH